MDSIVSKVFAVYHRQTNHHNAIIPCHTIIWFININTQKAIKAWKSVPKIKTQCVCFFHSGFNTTFAQVITVMHWFMRSCFLISELLLKEINFLIENNINSNNKYFRYFEQCPYTNNRMYSQRKLYSVTQLPEQHWRLARQAEQLPIETALIYSAKSWWGTHVMIKRWDLPNSNSIFWTACHVNRPPTVNQS